MCLGSCTGPKLYYTNESDSLTYCVDVCPNEKKHFFTDRICVASCGDKFIEANVLDDSKWNASNKCVDSC